MQTFRIQGRFKAKEEKMNNDSFSIIASAFLFDADFWSKNRLSFHD